MAYMALTEQEKDQLTKDISSMIEADGKPILQIIIALALEFDTSVKAMVELCLINIVATCKDKSEKLTIIPILSRSYKTQGMRIKHIAFSINDNPTRVLILVETETIVKISNLKELSTALLDLQQQHHSSTLGELHEMIKDDKPTN